MVDTDIKVKELLANRFDVVKMDIIIILSALCRGSSEKGNRNYKEVE